MEQMPFDPSLNLERGKVEAWGLWWIQWQTQTKERLRRHMMSTQMRLKQFEEKHLLKGEDLLGGAAASSLLSPK
jgi:hypothetical protein